MRHLNSTLSCIPGAVLALRILLLVGLFAGADTASAQTPKLRVRGQLQYVHGVNIGWMFGRYSSDIGTNPLHPEWGTGYNSLTAGNWMADVKRLKVNTVRLWLFEGLEGLEFDTNGLVTRIQPQFLTNLDDLMSQANSLGLAFELVLLTHTLDLEFGQQLPNGAVISNFITNGPARQSFIANVVAPLSDRYKSNPALFSIDIMNESDLGVARNVCTRTQLRTFVTQVANNVHSKSTGIQVTCSCAFYKFGNQDEHNSWYGGLGLDYYENHNYATAPNLKTVPSWLDRPLLLGEYGPDLPPPNFDGSLWTEADQNASTSAHLAQAKNRGWAGALAWMYYHSNGNGENLVRTPGGNQDWETSAVAIRDFGDSLLSPPSVRNVFVDKLVPGWSNWSWDGVANFAATDKVFSGTHSIRVNSTAGWSALSLRQATAVNTSGYTKLRFAVYTPDAIRPFGVFIQTTDNGPASPSVNIVSTANAWKVVDIPLTSLGSPLWIKRINVQSATEKAIGLHYFDSIKLLP